MAIVISIFLERIFESFNRVWSTCYLTAGINMLILELTRVSVLIYPKNASECVGSLIITLPGWKLEYIIRATSFSN